MEKLGLRPERLQLEWISAAEGVRFKDVMQKMEELRKGVSSQEVVEILRILQEEAERKAARAAKKESAA